MDAITEKQKSLIVNNIVKACDDIEKLNGTGYRYIYLACGFIAHYNINGFKAHYSEYDLARDILSNARSNQFDIEQTIRAGRSAYRHHTCTRHLLNFTRAIDWKAMLT